jgi:tRNA 2-thiocytidine biosynthesis protein TtcA
VVHALAIGNLSVVFIVPSPEFLLEKIRKHIVSAIADYELIGEGDRILVAVSGGKDSSVLLYMLEEIRKRSPVNFSLQAVLLDQKQPGFNVTSYKEWVESIGLTLQVIEEDTYAIVKEKTEPGKSYCGLCSRLRRGILYNYAVEHGFSKIALGHHRDDFNQTVLMNLFYSGMLAAMPPKLRSDDGRNVVIRPLCYLPEDTIAACAEHLAIPVIPCRLCGSQDGMKRERVKKLLRDMEKERGDISWNILAALQNVRPSQLMDKNIFDFNKL